MWGYPSHVTPVNGYRYLNHLPQAIKPSYFYHLIGAGLVIMGIYGCKKISKCLENCLLLKAGQISFALYLLHIPILFTVGTGMFEVMSRYSKYYGINVLASFWITFIVLLFTAYIFHRTIEHYCENIIGKMMRIMGRKEEK